MKTVPVIWVFDYQPELLSASGVPVYGDPIVLILTSTLTARWPAPVPGWFSGAEPYVSSGLGTVYGGPLSAYVGPVGTVPSIAELAQFEQDLVTSLGPRQDLRFTFVGGVTTDQPQPYGQLGELQLPDDWNTDELATEVRFFIFPPDGGWCMRAYFSHPAPRKRIARYAPEEGALFYELDDNNAAFAAPITAGDLVYAIEVDGVVTEQRAAFTPVTGDFYGGRLFVLDPAEGWSPPGWSGHIYEQGDFSVTTAAITFSGSRSVDLGAPGSHRLRWRLSDHEGRATPWIEYLVPPVAAIQGLRPGTDAAANDELILGDALQFVSASRDADGSIARYDWDFGDGTTSSQLGDGGAVVTHSYEVDGQYNLSLRVFDDDGLSHRQQYLVTVAENGNIARLFGPDHSLLVAAPRDHNVELAAYPGAGSAESGENARQVLHTWENAHSPSLWRLPGGELALLLGEGDQFQRWVSRDGGRTWR